MPKKSRRSRKQKKSKETLSTAITSIGRALPKVPPPINKPYRIRRSWTQDIAYYGTAGWFNSGNPDFQINFAASVSNIAIGGVLTFGPTTINSAELSNLFDQYRIMSVTVRIDWDYNAYSPASGTAVAPLLYYVADYDDSGSAPLSSLLQYPGLRTHSFLTNGYSPLVFQIKPKPLRDVAGTGLLTSYGPMTAPWIRTAEMTTPHYGMKFCANQFALGGSVLVGNITITCYIDMEMANPR